VASWLMSGDPNQAADMAAQTQDGIQPPAIPSHVNPNMRVSSDVNMMSISSINFGPNTVGIIRKLLQDFVALIVITYLLKSLIDQMPTIASEIGGSRVGIFSSAPSAAERQIKGMISGIEQKFSGGGK
ncbi:MAG: hypothetical protein EBR02_06610, partial [Alphaproteobacteria bacterium]|nr:hypothetical protein [Alphaproteobacteria bacterium]